MHLLGTGPKSRVLILRDVERNLQISVHVLKLFPLLLLKDRRLVSLAHGVIVVLVVSLLLGHSLL